MGRKKIESGVRELYDFDKETNKSSCLICDFSTNGSHLGNLKKHLIRNHEEIFKEIETAQAQPTEDEPVRKKIKITVEYDPVELLDAWLNLVIKEGRPFCILNSTSLRTIVKPLFDALNIRTVNSSNISAEIKARAEKLRLHITKMLANKIISIKIDSASRHTRRVMCINVQTIIKGKIVIQTLSMSEMNRSHTGVNLKEYVLKVLETYKISLDQVYSITTDNGRNMVCAGGLLIYEHSDNETNNDVRNDDTDSDDSSGDSSDDEDETDEQKENDEAFTSNLEALRLDGVHVERCASHTLALAVDDSMKKAATKKSIHKCRKLAKYLRTPNTVELLRSLKLKTAKLDNKTRWNSKYDMVLSITNLKNFCESQNITILNDSDWEFCDIFLEVYKPVMVTTKLLQAPDLALGDFFKIWLDMTLRVQQLTKSSKHTALASYLYEQLMEREAMLFKDNDTLLAALYLDPRFHRVLKKIRPQYFDEIRARNHLISLFKKVKKIEQQARERRQMEKNEKERETAAPAELSSVSMLPESTGETSSDSGGPSTLRTPSDSHLQVSSRKEDHFLESYMDELFDDDSHDEHNDLEDDILAAIQAIRNYNDKKPLNTNVIQYWYGKRFSDATLSKLALILHAVPATQVSVERCFSTLKFILNDYRTNIRSDTLADLMLLKLNAK